jgi:hypothetical protein
MYIHFYLRKGIVYLPTVGKMGQGFYRNIEPVAKIPVVNTDALHQAIAAALKAGNPEVPIPPRRNWPRPIIPKHAGVKSWSAFEHGMQLWSLEEKDSTLVFDTHFKSPNRMWVRTPEKQISFAAATPANEVIGHVVATLQKAAGE